MTIQERVRKIANAAGVSAADPALMAFTLTIVSICVDVVDQQQDSNNVSENEWQRGRRKGLDKAIEAITTEFKS